MAGAVGKVSNRSGFSSFLVKEWQPWMTEAVVLHTSGMSIAELVVKYQRTNQYLYNIFNTDQARKIVRDLQAAQLRRVDASVNERMSALRAKALENMEEIIEDKDKKLRNASPFAFLEANRKVYETMSRHDVPMPAPQSSVTNIQNNIIGSVDPATIARLRAGAATPLIEVPENVEYLGSPPPREVAGELYAGRDAGASRQGED